MNDSGVQSGKAKKVWK